MNEKKWTSNKRATRKCYMEYGNVGDFKPSQGSIK